MTYILYNVCHKNTIRRVSGGVLDHIVMLLSVPSCYTGAMEKEIIAAMVASLPPSIPGDLPKDQEMWEEIDGGATLFVTRSLLPGPGNEELIALSVKGEPSERHRVITEFIAVFGPPALPVTYSEQPVTIEIATWLVVNPYS